MALRSWIGLTQRSLSAERMDAEGFDGDVMADALKRVGGFTRSFGGVRAVRRHLDKDPTASLLDVGAGDLALIEAVSLSHPNSGPCVGVDAHADVVGVAGRNTAGRDRLHVVRADGRELPFPDRSFDLVISTLTLHHLDDSGATSLLAEMGRVSKGTVFVWDLERSAVALGGAVALAHTVWRRDPLVRYDAPLSVRRAFTADELRERAIAAGLHDVSVRRVWPARIELRASSGVDVGAGIAS